MKNALAVLAAAAVLAFAAPFASAASFKVIVNTSNPAASLSKGEVRDFFMGKKSKWGGGARVDPVDLPAEDAAREEFSDDVLGKPVAAVKSYWQRQIFSGKGVPPTEVPGAADVVSFVSKNAGAIGYVPDSAPTEGVKVLSLTD